MPSEKTKPQIKLFYSITVKATTVKEAHDLIKAELNKADIYDWDGYL